MKLDPKTTALLIIDMQNDFLDDEGYFAKSGWDISCCKQPIQSIIGLKAAMPAEVKVIYTATGYAPDGSDAQVNLHEIVPLQFKNPGGVPREGRSVLLQGSWGSQIIDELKPAEGDYVVRKRRYDAFYQTDLEAVLRWWGIKTLVLTGVVTEVCVETTARSAFNRDFDVIVTRDCVGGWTQERHENSLKAIEFCIGAVMSSREVISALSSVSS